LTDVAIIGLSAANLGMRTSRWHRLSAERQGSTGL